MTNYLLVLFKTNFPSFLNLIQNVSVLIETCRVDNSTRSNVQNTFTCCGFDKEVDKVVIPPLCEQVGTRCCTNVDHAHCQCPGCLKKLQSTINYAFKLCGWIGLFFSFTEVSFCKVFTIYWAVNILIHIYWGLACCSQFMGVLLTVRYRNQKDPRANPSAFL